MSRPKSNKGNHGQLADSFMKAFLRGDEDAASRVMSDALANGLDGPTIYLDGIQPALEQIGILWETGQALVAEEHGVTTMARWLMDALWDEFTPASFRGDNDQLLAGGVQGERHELGLIMVARFLRRDGWRVWNIGTDVPEGDFAAMSARFHPRLCLLSATMRERLEAVRATIASLRNQGIMIPVIVGGRVFRQDPGLVAAVGATGTATDAAETVVRVRQLLGC